MNKELSLDFSGGPKSWFDLWHHHIDWEGKGNTDWLTRKKNLEQLIEMFHLLKSNLANYRHDFQLWIAIDECDSGNDTVYIHSKNPNADNFPYKVMTDDVNAIKDRNLKAFVDALNFKRVRVRTYSTDIYFLYEAGTGIGLV